jgi:hypothetical protein
MPSRWSRNRLTVRATLLGSVLCMASCDVFETDTGPRSAAVRLEGTTGATVTLVSSTMFSVVRSEGNRGVSAQLIASDTTEVMLPYEQSFDIRQTRRVYVHLVDAETTAGTVHMIVWIDDQKRYEITANPLEATMRFFYAFPG